MEDHAFFGPAPKPSHGQGVDHELARHAFAHGPTNDLPAKEIDHHRQIEPALLGRDVGNVSRPYLIWLSLFEVSVKQVVENRQSMVAVSRGLVFTL